MYVDGHLLYLTEFLIYLLYVMLMHVDIDVYCILVLETNHGHIMLREHEKEQCAVECTRDVSPVTEWSRKIHVIGTLS